MKVIHITDTHLVPPGERLDLGGHPGPFGDGVEGAAKAKRFDRPDLAQSALAGFTWPTIGIRSIAIGSNRTDSAFQF